METELKVMLYAKIIMKIFLFNFN